MIRKILFLLVCSICFACKSFSCVGSQSYTTNPAPGPGNTYTAGQVVTFCYTINGYNQVNSNWLHGLTFTFGSGWNANSFTVVSAPLPVSGTGTWGYYPNGETSSNTGIHYSAGFYFETATGAACGCTNGNPGDNYGDDCASGNCSWTFCFSLQVSNNASPGASLSLKITPTGDGASGSWGNPGCSDPASSISTSTVAAHILVVNTTGTNVTCAGACNGKAIATASNGSPPYLYKWSTTPTQHTPNISNLCPGTYYVTVTDLNNTSATASITITQPAPITKTDSIVNPTCSGTCTGAVIVNATGGTLPYNYAWSAGAAPNASADYTLCAGAVNVVVTDSNHCSITSSYTLVDPPVVIVNLVSQSNALCYGSNTGSLTVSGTGGTSGHFNYHWSNSINGPTDSTLVAANYKVTATDLNGCTATGSYTISQPSTFIVIDSPVITNIKCHGLHDGAISAKANGGAGTLNYSWEEVSTSAFLFGQTITNLSADSYNLTVTDSTNCQALANYQVLDAAALTIDSLTISAPTCYGVNNGTGAIYAHGGTGNLNYNWNGTAADTTALLNNIGTGPLTITILDGNNCIVKDSAFVTQPPQIVINVLNQVNVLCNAGANGSITISTSGGVAGYTYLWNNYQTGPTDTALAAGAVTVTVTDSHACTVSQTFNITQTSTLVANPLETDNKCFSAADGLIDANITGGSPPYSFMWSDSQSTQIAHALPAGTYTCTVTDYDGCTLLATSTVNQPEDIVIYDSTIAVKCNGQNSGMITIAATGGVSPFTFACTQDEAIFKYAQNGIITQLDTGIYSVIASDGNGCTKNIAAYVPSAVPDSFTTATDSTLCYGVAFRDGAAHIVATTLQNAPYQYGIDGGAFQLNGYFPGLAAGAHLILAINTNGCIDSLPVSIYEPPPVIVQMVPDTIVIPLGQSQSVKVNYLNISNAIYSWEPAMGLSCMDCAEPVLSPYVSGTYTVTASMQSVDAICSGYNTLYVEVLPERNVFVPNAFSPNGDGNNDVFKIYGENIKSVELKIFNRWGEMIYYTNNQFSGWDGTYKGQMQQPGIFIYEAVVTFLDNKQTSQNGSLTLIR